MAEKEKTQSFDLESIQNTIAKMKIPLYYLVIALSILGIITTIVMSVIGIWLIGTIEEPIVNQINSIETMVTQAEKSIDKVDNQLNSFNATLTTLGGTMSSLTDSFETTGSALTDLGAGLESIGILNLGQYGAQLKTAGTNLETTAAYMNTLNRNIIKNREALFELQTQIREVKTTVGKQKSQINEIGESIGQTFLYGKTMVVLFGLIMLFLNIGMGIIALAGLAEKQEQKNEKKN